MITKKTWILVADGARGCLYLHDRDGLRPAQDHMFAAPVRAPVRAVESDRPGRSFDSIGRHRHALEPNMGWKDHERLMFARRMAAELEAAAERGAFDRLVLVAPPAMLGRLRDALGKQATSRLAGALGKDLTHLPPPAMAARIQAMRLLGGRPAARPLPGVAGR